ncbi:MAG TPA: Gfo/Idh/MocA family oxidoreductase, partial [Candidatus Saccharicenans sp.]|nr:Gfo/Idh/MocA family oxidoreductase [Candidatus Saccharicenans sp.]
MIEGQESISQIPQLKYAMIGGGIGSFIGDVHRKAIAMDGKARLVAGCFSRNYENNLKTGETLRLDKNRLYRNYEELLQAEARHPDRPDFIVIVTPNDSHYPISRLALE